jgi:Tfp pilus assembly protein PilV
MITIGPYILYGIIAIFGIGSLALAALLLLNSRQTKQDATDAAELPREDSLAEQIQKQFRADDERKERIIYNKSGITKATMKETRSAFSFENQDTDNELTLESQFADDDVKEPFIEKNSEDRI